MPNPEESNKSEKFLVLLRLLFFAFIIVMPLALPVLLIGLQAMVWIFIVAKLPGVYFTLRFMETCLFVSLIGLFSIGINWLILTFNLKRLGKNYKEYNLELQQKAEAANRKRIEEGREGAIEMSTIISAFKSILMHCAIYTTSFSVTSYFLPGKVEFSGLVPFACAILLIVAVRELYTRLGTLIINVLTSRMKQQFEGASKV
ncbi:MAG: hypothetical protein K2Y32_12825 [Candidatus Obscuribacterales bacterium]|nr:hypothetical protein [Candidatus Obscuribacterales bacterium]